MQIITKTDEICLNCRGKGKELALGSILLLVAAILNLIFMGAKRAAGGSPPNLVSAIGTLFAIPWSLYWIAQGKLCTVCAGNGKVEKTIVETTVDA
jgi:hypothetical protein